MANYALFMFLSFLKDCLALLPCKSFFFNNWRQTCINLCCSKVLLPYFTSPFVCLIVCLFVCRIDGWMLKQLDDSLLLLLLLLLPLPLFAVRILASRAAKAKVFYLKCKVFNNFDYWRIVRRQGKALLLPLLQCQIIKSFSIKFFNAKCVGECEH